MKKFKNLKIRIKLIIGFFIVAIIAGVVGLVGIKFTSDIKTEDTELYEENTMGMYYVSECAISFQRIRVNVAKVVIDNSRADEILQKIDTYVNTIDTNLKEYKEHCILNDEDQQVYSKLETAWTAFSKNVSNVKGYFEQKDFESAKALFGGDMQDAADALQEEFDNTGAWNATGAKEKSEENVKLAQEALFFMILVILIGMFIAITLGIGLSKIISVPVLKMVEVAKQVAAGDVNARIDVDSKDEIGTLAESMRQMVANIREQAYLVEKIAEGDMTVDVKVRSEVDLLNQKLKEMVDKNNEILGNISLAAEQVAAGSRQVSDSSIALSQGATEQASSIEELTSSLEEISSQTKMNAENATQANEIAKTAEENAIQGNSQMKAMQTAMEEINVSSTNISKIIKVIDDIAFQTNILALNAAVEAARAGQHGKGFAVVAEEVRNLAARSANAAKETTDLIEGSIAKVTEGTKIANDTATALNVIVSDIAKVASLVSDITIASNEQASAISQINQGIMQVSEVVQTNSATAEESASASEELSSQAELLKDSVSQFQLKANNRGNNGLNELSPEILKMLEGMSEKNTKERSEQSDYTDRTPKAKIILSDSEFGKF